MTRNGLKRSGLIRRFQAIAEVAEFENSQPRRAALHPGRTLARLTFAGYSSPSFRTSTISDWGGRDVSGDSTNGLSPSQLVYRLLNGHVIARAAYMAIELELADKIRDGHTNAESLANAASVDTQIIYRILRILAGQGVFRESEDRQFALTSLGEALLSDSPESIAAHGRLTHHPATWAAIGDLSHTVRTGETAFDHVIGKNWVEHMAADDEFAEVFHRAMNGLSRMHNSSVAEAYDFSRHNLVVDVGGGNGALLSAILSRNEELSGILLDRESAINQARQGIGGPLDRCELVVGDFFAAVPSGGDAYILKVVLHDWKDDECIRILSNCREAMADGGRVLVVDRLIGSRNEASLTHIADMFMMTFTGGIERSESEFEELFNRSRLELVRTTPTSTDINVLEAAAA